MTQSIAPPASAALSARRFAALVGVLGAYSVGLGAVFSLLPDLQDEHGIPTSGLGVIAGISVVTSVSVQLLFAKYADRGRTGRMLRIGVVCIALGLAWFAFASSLWEFVAARGLAGVGAGLYTPAARRTIVVSDPPRAGVLLGRATAVDVFGFMIGPPLAVTLRSLFGLQAPFLVTASLMVVAGLLLGKVPEAELRSTATEAEKGAARRLWADRRVRAAVVIGTTVTLSVAAFEPIIAKQLRDVGAGDAAVAITLSLFAVPYVFFTPLGGRLADRYGAHRCALLALYVTVPVVAGFGLAGSAIALAVMGLLRSLFDTVTTPSGISAMARSSPPDLVAAGQGLYGAASSAMYGVTAVLSAPLYAAFGPRTLWAIIATIMALMTAYATWLTVRCGAWSTSATRPVDA